MQGAKDVCLNGSVGTHAAQLALLQEELKDSQRVLVQLEEARTALQASADEYERLVQELKERKDKHATLKVRSRELKQIRRQHIAKERALKELLE